MPDVKRMRRWFTVALIVLGAICVASAGVLLSPIGHESRTGHDRLDSLRADLRKQQSELGPLSGIDQKVLEAGQQIAEFYDQRLPASYASISARLNQLAEENIVQIGTGNYQSKPAAVSGLERVRIEANITGNYLQTVKFINALERDHMFFLIDGVFLGEPQAGLGIKLKIRMETYLRTSRAAAAQS